MNPGGQETQLRVLGSQAVGATHFTQKLDPLTWTRVVGQMQVKLVGSRMWLVGQTTQECEVRLKKAGGAHPHQLVALS
jgi:hypothetical protein